MSVGNVRAADDRRSTLEHLTECKKRPGRVVTSVHQEGVIFSAFLLFCITSFSVTGARSVSDITVTISDSTCTCNSPSDRTFDCTYVQREIRRQTAYVRKNQPAPNSYKSATYTTIKKYLDSTGYFGARWDTAGSGSAVINPGHRTIILNEQCNLSRRTLTDAALAGVQSVHYPRPFNSGEVKLRAAALCSTFTRSGYPFVAVTTDLKPAGSRDTVELLFTIDPDEYCIFAPPQLRGSFTTNRTIILRDIAVKPGIPFDDRMIVESLERLHTRNYISGAAALPPVIAPRTAGRDGTHPKIIVPFEVSDRSGMGLEGAAGLEAGNDDTPRFNGNVRFAFSNLFHAGEEAALTYAGDRTRQRLDIDYSQPWLFGLPFTGSAGGGLEVVSDSYGYLFGTLGLYYEPLLRWRTGVILSGNQVSRKNLTDGDGTFIGADIALTRIPEQLHEGAWCRELTIVTGSGITRKDRMYSRSHVDFIAGVHLPMLFRTALLLRGGSAHLITREQNLVASELYRIGRSVPVRGYMEDEYAFRTIVYAQTELLYYFQRAASAYLFFDGGMGFEGDIGADRSHHNLGGYGIGVRLPAGIGSLSVEWARNITDSRTPGRIHVRFRNSFSAADKTLLPVFRK